MPFELILRRLGARPQGSGDLHHARDARLPQTCGGRWRRWASASSSCRARATRFVNLYRARDAAVRWTIPSSRPCSRSPGAAIRPRGRQDAQPWYRPNQPPSKVHLRRHALFVVGVSSRARFSLVQTTIYESCHEPAWCSPDKPAAGATPVDVAPANVVTRCPIPPVCAAHLRRRRPPTNRSLSLDAEVRTELQHRRVRCRGAQRSGFAQHRPAAGPALMARPCREATDRQPGCTSARTTGVARRGPTATSTRCRSRSSMPEQRAHHVAALAFVHAARSAARAK